MFRQLDTTNNNFFIKSLNVQAFPCGRRRSTLINNDTNNISDSYYIPFDPEARLNTEFNNTHHSGLNGFTQSYLKDFNTVENILEVILSGYLFRISFSDKYRAIEEIANSIGASEKIYANILLEKIQLYYHAFEEEAKSLDYKTWILRNQTATGEGPLTELDIAADQDDINSIDNYYFSGLSFSSTVPGDADNDETRVEKIIVSEDGKRVTKYISLCIFVKDGNTWKVNEPARLPKIEHGETEDSVKMDTLDVTRVYQDGISVPSLKIEKDTENNTYQLHFFNIQEN